MSLYSIITHIKYYRKKKMNCTSWTDKVETIKFIFITFALICYCIISYAFILVSLCFRNIKFMVYFFVFCGIFITFILLTDRFQCSCYPEIWRIIQLHYCFHRCLHLKVTERMKKEDEKNIANGHQEVHEYELWNRIHGNAKQTKLKILAGETMSKLHILS